MQIATLKDLPTIREMSIKFINKTEYKTYWTETSVDRVITTLITGDPTKGIIILDQGGFIAGQSSPFIFGDKLMASELCWWVEPDYRKTGLGSELFSAFEYWAKEVAKCELISMMTLDASAEKFYHQKGYKLCEKAYIKEI